MLGISKRARGFLMVSAALTAIVFILLTGAIAGLYSGIFSMQESHKTAFTAQQYAEIDANTLSLLPYDELNLAAHGRQGIEGADGWQSEISLGPEKTIGNDNKQRIGTIKVYKDGEDVARASLQVPLSQRGNGSLQGDLKENGWTQLENGLILQWGHMGIGEWTTVYFPKPFPNKCVSVEVNTIAGNKSSSGLDYVYNVSNTNFSAVTWNYAEYYWFAVGY